MRFIHETDWGRAVYRIRSANCKKSGMACERRCGCPVNRVANCIAAPRIDDQQLAAQCKMNIQAINITYIEYHFAHDRVGAGVDAAKSVTETTRLARLVFAIAIAPRTIT